MFRTLAALAAFAAVATPASATCYRTFQTSYYPTISYSYTQHGYNNYYTPTYVAQKVVVQEVAVAPLVVTVPVVSYAVPVQSYGASHYYSVQESYQQRQTVRDVIREELRSFLATQGALSPGGGPLPGRGAPLPREKEKEKGPEKAYGSKEKEKRTDLGPDTTTPEATATAVVAAFKESCAKCHGEGTTLRGDLRLVYVEPDGKMKLARHDSKTKWTIYGMASTGVMPPEARADAAKAMKQSHLPALLRWVLTPD